VVPLLMCWVGVHGQVSVCWVDRSRHFLTDHLCPRYILPNEETGVKGVFLVSIAFGLHTATALTLTLTVFNCHH